MKTTKEKVQDAFGALKGDMGYANVMQAPRLSKVVVSIGTGKVQDKNKLSVIQERLARITGQKSSPRPAKKSIASFKLREGDIIGYQITLRGARMYSFLDKLIHIALPSTKDFRGIKVSAIDDMGNITIGIKEHTIFPETADEDVKDIFSFAITIVTTAKTKPEAEAFFRHIGIPLQHAGTVEKSKAKAKTKTRR
jgi:large subunit ribosomal protein L5